MVLARTEPFRSLLVTTSNPLGPSAASPLLSATPSSRAEPRADALTEPTGGTPADAQVSRSPLERRLDALALPAGTTSLRSLRSVALPAHSSPSLVPLRLDAPSTAEHGLGGKSPAVRVDATPFAPAVDEITRPDLKLVAAARSATGATPTPRPGSIRARVRQHPKGRVPSAAVRPLPRLPAGMTGASSAAGDKVLTFAMLARYGVRLRAFSTKDVDVDIDVVEPDAFDDVDVVVERQNRSLAAAALTALSDEGDTLASSVASSVASARAAQGQGMEQDAGPSYPAAAEGDLDVLAEAWGLTGGLVVPRHAGQDGQRSAAIAELALAESTSDGIVAADDLVFAESHAAGDDDAMPSESAVCWSEGSSPGTLLSDSSRAGSQAPDGSSRGPLPLLPSSLFIVPGRDASAGADPVFVDSPLDDDSDLFVDDNEVTPPRGTPRPTLVPAATGGGSDASRTSPVEVTAIPSSWPDEAEFQRNRRRARELYLIALDDLGEGDARSAIGHLQLAVAYDDGADVYRDLLAQLLRNQQRAG
jgi:hypothetical protein